MVVIRPPAAAGTAFVVAALVAAQGLPGGERLLADITDVSPSNGGRRGGARRGAGDRRGLVVGSRQFPVAGLVAAQSLVGGEDLVAKGALVAESGGGHGGGRLWQGPGTAAGEHDEAESKVLIFGWRAVDGGGP